MNTYEVATMRGSEHLSADGAEVRDGSLSFWVGSDPNLVAVFAPGHWSYFRAVKGYEQPEEQPEGQPA